MPSNAGSPNIGARNAQPLLPFVPSLKSNSKMKSPYSFSLISHDPRGLPLLNTPSFTDHTGFPSAGWETSFHLPTRQPAGTPSLGKSGTNPLAFEAASTVGAVRVVQPVIMRMSERTESQRVFIFPFSI